MAVTVVAMALAAVLLPRGGQEPPLTLEPAPSSLQRVLQEIAGRYPADIGVYVKHLASGEEARFNADASLRSASLYKLFVLYVAHADLEARQLALDEVLRLSPEASAAHPFLEWPEGTTTSVGCALEAMVTRSSNAAAEMLLARLGGESRITREMQALGLTGVELTTHQANASAADVGRLLEMIGRREAVSPSASDRMLELLFAQQRSDVVQALPLGLDVAHKTGELQQVRNDAGIVFAPSGPYVYAVLVTNAASHGEARAALLAASGAAYTYFEGDPPLHYGLPERLALDVFRTFDAEGRLAPLLDAWAVTVPAARAGVDLYEVAGPVTVHDAMLPDLLALQQAAALAGRPFWVTAGYLPPHGRDLEKALITREPLSCPVQVPPRPRPATPVPAEPGEPPAPPAASQHWLGTVVHVAESPDGWSPADFSDSETGRWLIENAWRYGFIPALPEPPGSPGSWEPWKLRWVGREMAAYLRRVVPEGDPAIVARELERARSELTQRGAPSRRR